MSNHLNMRAAFSALAVPVLGLAVLGLALAVPMLRFPGMSVPILLAGALGAMVCAALAEIPGLSFLERGLRLGLLAYAGLLLAGPVFEAGHKALAALADPLAINPLEGVQALRVWLTAHGRTIYTALTGNPYLVTVYMPFFYVAAAPLVWLGLRPLLAGRLVSLGSAMAMLLCAGHWVRLRTGSLAAGGLVVLALAGHRYGFEYLRLCRVDSFAWALFFAGAALFLEALTGAGVARRKRFFLGAAMAMAMAFFAKQQMAFYAAGLALWIPLFRRDLTRDGLKYFALPACLAGLALFGVYQAIWGGTFWMNAVIYPKYMSADPQANTTAAMVGRLADFYAGNTALILLWTAHLGYGALRRRLSPLDLSLLGNLPILALSLRWYGADANYFIGPVVILYCGLAESLADLWGRRFGRGAVLAALAALTLAGQVSPGQWLAPGAPENIDSSKQEALAEAMHQAGGNALVEAESSFLALDSRASYFDGYELGIFARYHLWDPAASALYADVANQRFARIIDGSGFTPPEFRQLIESHYATLLEVDGTRIYAPRETDASITISGPDAQVTADTGLSASVRLDHAAPPPGEDCLAPAGGPEARVVLEITSQKPLRAVSLLFFPRIHQGSGNALSLEGHIDGGQATSLYALSGNGENYWTPIGDLRPEVRLSGSGYRAELTFTLRNKAQLWLDPKKPMRIFVDFQLEPKS